MWGAAPGQWRQGATMPQRRHKLPSADAENVGVRLFPWGRRQVFLFFLWAEDGNRRLVWSGWGRVRSQKERKWRMLCDLKRECRWGDSTKIHVGNSIQIYSIKNCQTSTSTVKTSICDNVILKTRQRWGLAQPVQKSAWGVFDSVKPTCFLRL